ncbi:Alpha/Beta hydrolase protein [Xylariaceae sp. FL0016]|nr:Alpha/Beta hydrolase protein [Xylariaceae sp. FL0016]
MKSFQASLATLVVWLSGTLASVRNANGSSLHVSTTSGEAFGTINATSPNVRQFLGIPYAQPPVSELRFQSPVQYTSNKAINASAFSPSCLQPITTPEAAASSLYNTYLPKFLPGIPEQSEDCLYLNVYAPLEPKAEKLPVFVWIHGGGFTADSSNVPYQIPDQWVERTQELVVVTMNYRLNIFGFPNAADQPLNIGLQDQRMAVEWARDNVAAFGGDPDRMVLWGQSAGAWSVNYYGYAYPEDPIVAGLIADSGGSTVFSTGNTSYFTAVAAAAGCGDLDAEAELECMQGLDATTLQAVASNTTGVSFGPSADNVTVFANNTERAEQGLVANVPAIIGTNSREGSGFVSWSEGDPAPSDEEIIQASALIVCPTVSEIQNRIDSGLTSYRYEYSGNFSNITPLPWIGAIHSGELPLVFGTHFQYNGNSTESEWEVSFAMEGLWLSFAQDVTEDPTYDSFTWPKFDPSVVSMASFAVNDTVLFLADGTEVDDTYCG